MKKLISITAAITALIIFTSCANTVPTIVFSSEETMVQPGLTTELTLSVIFSDDAQNLEPSRKDLKTFGSADPVIKLSNPGVKLLSVNSSTSKSGIEARIILLASDELLSGSSASIDAEWAGCSAAATVYVKKKPSARIDSAGVVTDPAAYDVFVNKQRRLPADYIPPDLVRVEVPTILTFEEVNHLRRAASDALSSLVATAEAEQGYELLARSGYRSYATQVSLYQMNVREHGEDYASRFSAQPGTSEHQSGLAMDVSSPVVNYQLVQEFGETDEGIWLADNAHRFGFIIRYMQGKEEITGYSYEPWHLRYLGTELATEIYSHGLTLEEYFTE